MERALLESSTGCVLDLPVYYKSETLLDAIIAVYTVWIILRDCTVRISPPSMLQRYSLGCMLYIVKTDRKMAWYCISALQLGFIYTLSCFCYFMNKIGLLSNLNWFELFVVLVRQKGNCKSCMCVYNQMPSLWVAEAKHQSQRLRQDKRPVNQESNQKHVSMSINTSSLSLWVRAVNHISKRAVGWNALQRCHIVENIDYSCLKFSFKGTRNLKDATNIISYKRATFRALLKPHQAIVLMTLV